MIMTFSTAVAELVKEVLQLEAGVLIFAAIGVAAIIYIVNKTIGTNKKR